MTYVVVDRLRNVLQSMPAAQLLGIDVAKAGKGHAVLTLEPREDLTEHSGRIQGGVLGAFIDFAGVCACGTVIQPSEFLRTIDFSVKLHEPAELVTLVAIGKVQSQPGRRVLTSTVTVAADTHQDVPIATGLVSAYVVRTVGRAEA